MYALDYGKGYVHCSFCGGRGHNITSCQKVTQVFKNTNYDIKTHEDDGTLIEGEDKTVGWIRVGNWHKLTSTQRKAFTEMARRDMRQKKRKKLSHKKSKPRCSFCRREGHRRPNCKHLKKFKKTLYKANTYWRKSFANFIDNTGLGLGALLKVPRTAFWWTPAQSDAILCMITEYSFDKIHLFAAHSGRDDYRTNPYMILTDVATGTEYKVFVDKIKAFVGSGLVHSRGWGSVPVDIVSGAKWSKPPEWVYETHNQELDFLVKNISTESYPFADIFKHINSWNKGE